MTSLLIAIHLILSPNINAWRKLNFIINKKCKSLVKWDISKEKD
jgi:hypothetical protein